MGCGPSEVTIAHAPSCATTGHEYVRLCWSRYTARNGSVAMRPSGEVAILIFPYSRRVDYLRTANRGIHTFGDYHFLSDDWCISGTFGIGAGRTLRIPGVMLLRCASRVKN